MGEKGGVHQVKERLLRGAEFEGANGGEEELMIGVVGLPSCVRGEETGGWRVRGQAGGTGLYVGVGVWMCCGGIKSNV